MKTLAIGFEILVRMVLFAALFSMMAAQRQEQRKLVRVRVRSGH